MIIKYDSKSDAIYIAFQKNYFEKEILKTIQCEFCANSPIINVDIDVDNKIVGIEIIGAKSHLPKDILENSTEYTTEELNFAMNKIKKLGW